jgi:hypothetical protein
MRALVGFLIAGAATVVASAGERLAAPTRSPASQAAPAPSRGATVSGEVEETIDASSYTYLRLRTPSGDVWAAVEKADVKKGARVTVVNAVPMDGFESKTLHRKFEHILFGSLAASDKGSAQPGAGAGKMAPLTTGHPSVPDAAVRSLGPIKVAKAEGPAGRTVAEIYAQRAALKGAEVAVRGKVVKFTTSVMGKNWAHLRDGSGSSEKANDDITVTTKDAAAVGDVVLVKGVVHLDRDFGAGYSYAVLIEDASLSK